MKNESLKTIADRRLSAMEWTGGQAVLEALRGAPARRMPATRRHYRLALILALAMLLALGTAVALGLIYSESYSQRKAADQALMQRYGFTQEAIGMFLVRQSDLEGGVRFVYEPHMQPKPVGTYTVVLPASGDAVATWSYDDADPASYAGSDLTTAIWDAPKLNTYVRLKNAYYGKIAEFDWENVDRWTLERRAEVDKMLREMAEACGEHVGNARIAPGPGDLSEQQAIALAKAALINTFGVDARHLDALDRTIEFFQYPEDGSRTYRVQFANWKRVTTPEDMIFEALGVDIASPSGEASRLHWYTQDPTRHTLPDGDLTGYRTAVELYMENGAFEALSASDKGRVAERIVKAGMADLLNDVKYVIPGSGVLTEGKALSLAQQALEDRHGVTQNMLTLFTLSAALIREGGNVLWQVTYTGKRVPYWQTHADAPMGDYTVQLDAVTGAAVASSWTLAGVETGTFTQDTWGQAEAYDSTILPWFMALLAERQAIVDRNAGEGDLYFMSVADSAAYAELFRRNGFPPERFLESLPGPDDLIQEQAQALALDALRTELHLSDEVIGQFSLIHPSFLMNSGNYPNGQRDPVWTFTFHHREGIYVVVMKAATGELLIVQYDPAASGNG